MQLSKSEYMLFLRQPAWLWLKKHDKAKLPESDPTLQALFDNGHLFETYVEQLFPNGAKIGFSFEENNYLTMPQRTKEAIENGTKTILQGRLDVNGLTCIFDVLERVEGNIFDLSEIKSTTSIKIEHEHDLAFQVVVLEQAGLTIRNVSVIHVNNLYKREGAIDVKVLTKTTDVTEAVRLLIDETKLKIQQAIKTIQSDTPPGMSPRFVRLGPIEEWLTIFRSLYPNLDPHSIYHLARSKPQLIGELEELGITQIKEIPDHIKLSEKQQRQVQATKTNQRLIEKNKIAAFLQNIKYPLYFLDYETLSSVIPSFDGIRPYQQVPFQYSLHILESSSSPLQHKEYLHTENTHPGLPLLQRLKADIGETGTVLVWYEKFEKGRNSELGEMFPEYAEFMQQVNSRIIDLMTPFSEGWLVDKDFYGSASIKKVLPVLVSELSYKDLAIQEGASAQRLWMETVFDGKHEEEKAQIMTDLIAYCKLDTLAMVQLYRVLNAEIAINS
jgi:hypothetical protein